jgi:tetratricopeptide (TPR) repeat protein
LETALAVARATGARHVVLGTAVTTGTQVRLAANLRELEGGTLVHQAHVDGQVDSMIVLVDQLSIQLLRFLLQELEGEPRANLASVTTGSLDALKAFLNGEQLYRRGEYGAADQAYTRAVDADSSFALAYYRLGLTRGWTEAAGTELAEEPLARAISLGNLPQRELGLTRAALAVVRGDESQIDSARVLASRYPDEAEAWYLLGELFYHEGALRNVGWEETEAALERAVDLDPTWAPHYIHLVDLAFVYHADSTIAADRMARYRQLAPASDWNRFFDVQFALAFADSASRSAAMAGLAASDLIEVRRVRDRMTHPRFWSVQEQVLLILLDRESGSEAVGVFRYLVQGNLYVVGRLNAALAYMDDSRASEALTLCDITGMEKTVELDSRPFERWFVPDSLGSAAADPGDLEALLMDPACRSMYAAYRGWEDQQTEHRGRLGEVAAAVSAGDSSAAVVMKQVLRLVDGLSAWLGGDAQRAYDILIEFTPQPDLELPRGWWAQILIETGRPDEAIPYLVGQRSDPFAHLYLGQAYEALGRDAEARDAYEYFLTYWADADPELQWLVDEARQGLTRIAARLN